MVSGLIEVMKAFSLLLRCSVVRGHRRVAILQLGDWRPAIAGSGGSDGWSRAPVASGVQSILSPEAIPVTAMSSVIRLVAIGQISLSKAEKQREKRR